MSGNRYDAYERLRFDRPADGVLRVTMHNPDNPLNSVDAKMHEELVAVWRDIDADRDVGAVILRGDDRAYSAGGDFGMIESLIGDHGYRMRGLKEARDIVYNVIGCSRPTIAAMHGVAVGAGLAAGMVCDITIATKSCRIIDGHTALGVAAGDHSVISWPLLCGMAKAKYYLMTCYTLTGEEAERIGLISLAVEDDALEAEALRVATRLAGGARTAISHTKMALNNWYRMNGPSFDASLGYEFLAWDGPEAKEGLAALKEKRKPNFGRMPV